MSKFFLCVILVYSFYIQQSISQQLNKAYAKKSSKLLDKFILKNRLNNSVITNDTSLQISALVSLMVNKYCKDSVTSKNPLSYVSNYSNEKYIVLQPNIATCFTTDLDSAELYRAKNPNRYRSEEDIDKELYQGEYRGFVSAKYYRFPNLTACKKYRYTVNIADDKPIPVITDTIFINQVNSYITGEGDGIKRYNKSKFLEGIIKLYPTRIVEILPSIGKIYRYRYNYNFVIDKIIFDKAMKNALIHYSFLTNSREALFTKVGDQWKMRRSHTILHAH